MRRLRGGASSTSLEDARFPDPQAYYDRPITEHGGGKYLRTIYPADAPGPAVKVDVYCVIGAFGVTCPALRHALEKILACGRRGKGDEMDDIHGVFDAMWRALELSKQRRTAAGGDHAADRRPAR